MRRGAQAAIAATALLAAALAAVAVAASAARDAAGAPGDPTLAFERATAAFAEGRYEEGADGYAAVAARHGASFELLFNLGNASFRAGRIGEAILAWEQARVLAPRASEIAANLRQARQAASLPDPEPGVWSRVVGLLSGDAWAVLASVCSMLACAVALGVAALRPRLAARPAAERAARTAIAALVVVLVVAGAAAATALGELDRAVVLGRDPVLRVAPYASATPARPIGAGEVVRVERVHAGFALLRAADGRAGWLPLEQVGRIGDLPGPGSGGASSSAGAGPGVSAAPAAAPGGAPAGRRA
jgi:tetratricopeptide (TPR) repeat protein